MDRTQLTIRLRPATHAKLKALAGREHRSMAQQVEHLIERAAAALPAAVQLDIEDPAPGRGRGARRTRGPAKP